MAIIFDNSEEQLVEFIFESEYDLTQTITIFDEHEVPEYGGSVLEGTNGSDKIYGDEQSYLIEITGASDVPGRDPAYPPLEEPINEEHLGYAGVKDLVITFGDNDILLGLGGDDEIFGDLETFEINMMGGDNFGLQSNGFLFLGFSAGNFSVPQPHLPNSDGLTLIFGDGDILIGGAGDDDLYGDVKSMNLTFDVGDNGQSAAHGVFMSRSEVLFGNDTLIGDVDLIHIEGTQSDAQGLSVSSTSNNNGVGFLFGFDTILGGDGNDLIVGDARVINQLGATLDDEIDPTTASIIGASHADAFYFGNDLLDGGNGNDWIYGDVETYNFIMDGGTGFGTNPQSFISIELQKGGFGSNNNDLVNEISEKYDTGGRGFGYVFGNDVIIGGDGENHLFGDIGDFNFTGVGSKDIQVPEGNYPVFGGVFFVLAAVGIANDFDFEFGFSSQPSGNIAVRFGNDDITGGADVDYIYGEGDDTLLGSSGNDILDGGMGIDSVSYAGFSDASGLFVDPGILVDFGAGEVTDLGALGVGTDTLVSVEVVTGTDFADTFIAGAADETVTGGLGSDSHVFDLSSAFGTDAILDLPGIIGDIDEVTGLFTLGFLSEDFIVLEGVDDYLGVVDATLEDLDLAVDDGLITIVDAGADPSDRSVTITFWEDNSQTDAIGSIVMAGLGSSSGTINTFAEIQEIRFDVDTGFVIGS